MRIAPFAALVLCGCYVTVPLTSTTPAPGTHLKVQLTDAGSNNLARYIGRDVVAVDGRLLPGSDDSVLSLSVNSVAKRSGDEQFWNGETVILPRGAIATVRQRKLSAWRSGLLASAFVAGIAALTGIGGGNSGGTSANPPPGQTK